MSSQEVHSEVIDTLVDNAIKIYPFVHLYC